VFEPSFLLGQVLSGLTAAMFLFVVASGLSLVFGVLRVLNFAHGSFYMVGAYVAAATYAASGSFLLGLGTALAAAAAVGIAVELAVFRQLYDRHHLDQVLATFGLLLFFNEAVRMIWGSTALYMRVPALLNGRVELLPGVPYPAYRLAIIGIGLGTAVLLYLLIARTRLGMLIRAGAANRVMLGALGVNVRLLYTLVFALGAMLAALAGVMAGPIFTVESGMGENVLILAFVVIVIGGIGSVRGAFLAALLTGIVDAVGRAFLRPLLSLLISNVAADKAGPALASMLIYIVMAAVLFFRPQGLFPPRTR
jgi:branched-chain amino acid transport system permease protein